MRGRYKLRTGADKYPFSKSNGGTVEKYRTSVDETGVAKVDMNAKIDIYWRLDKCPARDSPEQLA